jgi:hypothetical protein
MNGKDWNKKDTTYYVVYYREEYGKSIDVVTNDFGGWLKETNEDRVDEDHPDADCCGIKYDADDFWLKDVEMFFRKGRV